MNPLTLHQSTVIREIYRELGRGAEAEERVHRWYRLRDSMGPASVPAHQRVRDVKQYARDRIYREIFDDDRDAVQRFEAKEVKGFAPAEGVEAALGLLQSRSIPVAVVSESASIAAVRALSRFLSVHALSQYFQEVITPAGRFGVDGRPLDSKFVGATKKSGRIYEELRGYLQTRSIPSSAAAMIGDDPLLDVEHAKRYGFVTVQYLGVIDRGGREKADHVLTHWREIGRIL